MDIILNPVGIVKSSIKNPSLKADDKNISMTENKEKMRKKHMELKKIVTEIHIDEKFKSLLEGLEDFSHILVLYWPHLLPEKSRLLEKIHPMGCRDLPEKGIFATCSPARPNPVLVTAVSLLSIKGNILEVKGFEAVDGSLVIDIKPYSPHYYSPENVVVADWFREITAEMDEGIAK